MFGSKIKLCPTFIRKGSWIDLTDRSTSFVGMAAAQKTIIYGASRRSSDSRIALQPRNIIGVLPTIRGGQGPRGLYFESVTGRSFPSHGHRQVPPWRGCFF